MTEAEWLSCVVPNKLLAFLKGNISERKLRLLAVACCRRIWHLLNPDVGRPGIELIEQFADSEATQEDLAKVFRSTHRYGDEVYRNHLRLSPPSRESELVYRESQQAYAVAYAAGTGEGSLEMALLYSTQCAGREIFGCQFPLDWSAHEKWDEIVQADQALQCNVIRELVGNPFQTVKVNPGCLLWNGGSIPRIAKLIYDDRAFGHLPILADALEEASCTDAAILNHCRQPGDHFRGCWLVDLLTGKE